MKDHAQVPGTSKAVRERVSAALGHNGAIAPLAGDRPRPNPSTLSVLLADPRLSMRRELRRGLEQYGFDVVAEAATATEAVTLAEQRCPHLCLVELDLPGCGTVAISEIRRRRPRTLVAALTSSRAPSDVVEALRAGADGYLLKMEAPNRLAVALQALAAGEFVLPRSLTGALVAELRRSSSAAVPATSSRGQRRMLDLPRFVRHYRHRRQAGLTFRQAADRARDRMHDYH